MLILYSNYILFVRAPLVRVKGFSKFWPKSVFSRAYIEIKIGNSPHFYLLNQFQLIKPLLGGPDSYYNLA